MTTPRVILAPAPYLFKSVTLPNDHQAQGDPQKEIIGNSRKPAR